MLVVGLVLLIASASVAVAQQEEGRLLSTSLEIRKLSAREYLEAEPMPLRMIDIAPSDLFSSESIEMRSGDEVWGARAERGTGELNPEVLIPRRMLNRARNTRSEDVPESMAFGSASKHPFTVSRVDLSGFDVSTLFPFSAVGKLFITFGSSTFVCSAALIKKGVLLTAAHCIYDNVAGLFISSATFVPAYNRGVAPFGSFGAVFATVWDTYASQSACIAGGVVCTNDFGVIVLAQNTIWPGNAAGKLGYSTSGYGLTSNDEALFTQLGYPVSHDKGERMMRTDSQSYRDMSLLGNNIWGSSQTGGSSGGPEVVNLGKKPTIKKPGTGAKEKKANRIVCVTGWGYTTKNQKELGCSYFVKSLVKPLVDSGCSQTPKPC